MLWSDSLSESTGLIGSRHGLFFNSPLADGGGSQCAVHYDGCGEFENHAYLARSNQGAHIGRNSLGGIGSGGFYDCHTFGSGWWVGLCLWPSAVRQDGTRGKVRDTMDQFHRALEHDRGFSVGGFGEFAEVGKGGGVAFRNGILGIFYSDVLYGCRGGCN